VYTRKHDEWLESLFVLFSIPGAHYPTKRSVRGLVHLVSRSRMVIRVSYQAFAKKLTYYVVHVSGIVSRRLDSGLWLQKLSENLIPSKKHPLISSISDYIRTGNTQYVEKNCANILNQLPNRKQICYRRISRRS
jgi:hypothetical protein